MTCFVCTQVFDFTYTTNNQEKVKKTGYFGLLCQKLTTECLSNVGKYFPKLNICDNILDI